MQRDKCLKRNTIAYKYIKNSFRAGKDQLFAASWDVKSDECSIWGNK